MSHEPSNFSWVSESVAGFAFPYSEEHWRFLANEAKLSHVITMCEECPDYAKKFPTIEHHHLPVDNFTAASLSTIQKAMKIILDAEAQNKKVGVHCQYGQGRAGTILACYLAMKHGWNGNKAIAELRRLRPGSIDCDQERAVRQYAKSIGN